MLSDNFRAIDEAPTKTLLLIAAGLVIVCQLVAMVMVADGQVEKAQIREASRASARAAIAGCIESSHGAALKDCDRTASSLGAQVDPDQSNAAPQSINLVTLNHQY